MKGNFFFFNVFFFLSSWNNKPNEKIEKRNWKSGKDDYIVVKMAGNATTYPKQSRAELFFVKEFSRTIIIQIT